MAPLPCRKIGRTGLEIVTLGLGCASLGNLYRPVDDALAQATAQKALDAGLRYLDTAPYYGFGLSERRVGDVLRRQPSGSYVLSTKVGRLLQPCGRVQEREMRHGFCSPMPFKPVYDYSYDGVMRSYEDSLQRLGVEHIDILYMHDIGRVTHGDDHARLFKIAMESGYKALDELRSSGQISAFGLGVNEYEVCEEALEHGDFDCFMLAGRYTLLEQDALDTFLPKCTARNASVIIAGVYNSNILVLGAKSGQPLYYNYEPASEAIVERVRRLEDVCDEFQVPLPAAALQFPLACPGGRQRRCRHGQATANRTYSRVVHPPDTRRVLAGALRQGPAASRCHAARGMTEALMAGPLRIDGHQHFWSLSRNDYGWLTEELVPLYRDFQPADLRPHLREAGVTHTVLVQAAPTEDETVYLLELAEATDFIAGVVGWIDIESPTAPKNLETFAENRWFRGIRPMLQDLADPDWMLKPGIQWVYRKLAELDLCFDALIKPEHLRNLDALLQGHPQLKVVIDHGAKPDIAADAFQPWADDIARVARRAGAYCKLSGLLTEAGETTGL